MVILIAIVFVFLNLKAFPQEQNVSFIDAKGKYRNLKKTEEIFYPHFIRPGDIVAEKREGITRYSSKIKQPVNDHKIVCLIISGIGFLIGNKLYNVLLKKRVEKVTNYYGKVLLKNRFKIKNHEKWVTRFGYISQGIWGAFCAINTYNISEQYFNKK